MDTKQAIEYLNNPNISLRCAQSKAIAILIKKMEDELETYRWIKKHKEENEPCSFCCGTGLKQIKVVDEPGNPAM